MIIGNKKLLTIIVLGLLFSGNAYAETYDVVLKCEVKYMDKAMDFDKSTDSFGKAGETKYFHIQKDGLTFEANSNWDEIEKMFINWHEGDFISKKFIKFGFWPGKRERNSHIQINRGTGKMSFIGFGDSVSNSKEWYDADCDKINYDDLPKKNFKQKF